MKNIVNILNEKAEAQERNVFPDTVRIHAWVGQIGELVTWPGFEFGDHVIEEGDSWPLHISLDRNGWNQGPVEVSLVIPLDPPRHRQPEQTNLHEGRSGDARVDPKDWQYRLPGGDWQWPAPNEPTNLAVHFTEKEGHDYDPDNPAANAKTIELRFVTDSEPQEGLKMLTSGDYYEIWLANVSYSAGVIGPNSAGLTIMDTSPIIPPGQP